MFVVGFLAGVLTLALTAFYGGRPQDAPPREIVLVASDVAFYLAGQPDKPNPPITLKKGQSVKLVISNAEPDRVLHCFTIAGLNVKTEGSLAAGETENLLFTARKRGTYPYACLMHPSMTGKVVVE